MGEEEEPTSASEAVQAHEQGLKEEEDDEDEQGEGCPTISDGSGNSQYAWTCEQIDAIKKQKERKTMCKDCDKICTWDKQKKKCSGRGSALFEEEEEKPTSASEAVQ